MTTAVHCASISNSCGNCTNPSTGHHEHDELALGCLYRDMSALCAHVWCARVRWRCDLTYWRHMQKVQPRLNWCPRRKGAYVQESPFRRDPPHKCTDTHSIYKYHDCKAAVLARLSTVPGERRHCANALVCQRSRFAGK